MEISVIVPVYNVERFLPKCLDSLCLQADCVKEIILVNDGSTDGSLTVCEKYAKKDSRFRIVCQENKGTMAAIITGVNSAECEYIGFVDSDDYIAPDMYRKMADAMQRTKADMVVCDYFRIYSDGKKEYQSGLPSGNFGEICERESDTWGFPVLPTLKQPNGFSPFRWNKLFKKSILKNSCGFLDRHIPIGEDMALVIPILFEIKRIAYIKESLYFYEQRNGSLVHNYKTECFFGWKNLMAILEEGSKKNNYTFKVSFNDISLAVLLSVCLYKIRLSRLSKKEKKYEYQVIGEDEEVRSLLCGTKLRINGRHKIVFFLLKHRMYSLLARVY